MTELHVVFGGTGGAGAAVVRALLARGRQVRVVNRSGKASGHPQVEVVRADALDQASVIAACQGANIIYNCLNVPYTQWPLLFPTLWDHVTTAASQVGARLVVADNLYMYGPNPEPLRETTPMRACGVKGRTRIQMSETLWEAHDSGKVRVAAGRAADYYGPGISLSIYSDAVFRRVLAGKSIYAFGRLDLPHSQAFSEDVGNGLVTLGEHEEAFGEIWHLPHATPISQREFMQLMSEEAGQRARIQRIPDLLIRAAGLVSPLLREFAELDYQYNAPFVVDSQKFERAFGIQATPYREAIRQTFAWLQEQDSPPSPTAQARSHTVSGR